MPGLVSHSTDGSCWPQIRFHTSDFWTFPQCNIFDFCLTLHPWVLITEFIRQVFILFFFPSLIFIPILIRLSHEISQKAVVPPCGQMLQTRSVEITLLMQIFCPPKTAFIKARDNLGESNGFRLGSQQTCFIQMTRTQAA